MSKHPFGTIEFNVTARVEQSIVVVDDNLEPQDVVDGLIAGNYYTTIAHDGGFGQPPGDDEPMTASIVRFDEEGNEVPVAVIDRQRIARPENGEKPDYTDFTLTGSWGEKDAPF